MADSELEETDLPGMTDSGDWRHNRAGLLRSPVVLREVFIQNYKSIERCSVTLGPLEFLTGRNGSGTSNFLDALRFVANSLDLSVEQALRDRGSS